MSQSYTVQDIVDYNRRISNKLLDICEPIFNNFGFTSFGYTRIQNNGRRVMLGTNQAWLSYYWLRYYVDSVFNETISEKKTDPALIKNLENLMAQATDEDFHVQMSIGSTKKINQEQSDNLNLWNSISIHVPMNNFVEIYHLGTSEKENHVIMDLCINKKFLLERFFQYFRNKLRLFDLENAPFIVDRNLSKIFSSKADKKKIVLDATVNTYLKQTYINKFYLKTHGIFITRREAECLHHLAFGKLCKEIGRILKISPRTVEFHMTSIKNKTNAKTKSELIKVAHDNHLTILGLFND